MIWPKSIAPVTICFSSWLLDNKKKESRRRTFRHIRIPKHTGNRFVAKRVFIFSFVLNIRVNINETSTFLVSLQGYE